VTDEEQVRQMLALWSEADADKDPQAFAAQFTEDRKYVSRRGDSAGRAAIYQNLADRIAVNPPDRETMHLFAEAVVQVDGDTAHTRSGYVGYGRIGDGPWEVMSIGRFHTWLVRRDGKWLFTEVQNRSIGKAGGPATILHHAHV
jgi:uncharacterized protein (TIGR02246 family)